MKIDERGKQTWGFRRLSAKSRLGKKTKMMFWDIATVDMYRFAAETRVPGEAVK